MTPTTNPIHYLTYAEYAERYRVSRSTVYRLVKAGEIDAIRVGRQVRIPDVAA